MGRRRYRTHAFTLIEALVVIGIVGLLIGVTLPALMGARQSTGAVGSLANLRSLGQSLELAVQSNAGYYPMPGRRGDQWGPLIWEPPGNPHAAIHYYGNVWWYGRFFWPALLHDVAPWTEHYSTWFSPGQEHSDDDEPLWVRAPIVSYNYATCFFANPSVWAPGSTPTDRDIGRVNAAVVAHPGAKVIAYDRDRAYLRSRVPSDERPLLFADASASIRRDSHAASPVPNPLNQNEAHRYHDTAHGAAGRDF